MPDMPLQSLHARHPRRWRHFDYVYPVISRRAGALSIGINLNVDKVCNWDCVYCQVDRKIAPKRKDVDLEQLESELQWTVQWASSGECWHEPPFDTVPDVQRRLNDIAFSGDGEPTTFPHFLEACRIAVSSRAKWAPPETKILVLSNMTMAHRSAIQDAFALLDQNNGEIWSKLETGTAEIYDAIDRSAVPFNIILDNILATGKIRPIVIQSLFMRLRNEPPTAGQFEAYLDRLTELIEAGCRIKLIQVYTVARKTAESYVSALSSAELASLAQRASERLPDILIETYPGGDVTT
jgi:wyosine [tRNA(Phe)-imidazoG37] synthetase (radical SAM superfamily)